MLINQINIALKIKGGDMKIKQILKKAEKKSRGEKNPEHFKVVMRLKAAAKKIAIKNQAASYYHHGIPDDYFKTENFFQAVDREFQKLLSRVRKIRLKKAWRFAVFAQASGANAGNISESLVMDFHLSQKSANQILQEINS